MRTPKEVAQIVKDFMIENNLERVIDPRNASELDRAGKLCRVCLVGAVEWARLNNRISLEENARFPMSVSEVLSGRCDSVLSLNSVATREDMFIVLDEAAKLEPVEA